MRSLVALFWIALTGRSMWLALERGDPKGAIVPGILLLWGVWALFKSARRKQEAEYGPVGDSDPITAGDEYAASGREPWETGDTGPSAPPVSPGLRRDARSRSRNRSLVCPTCSAVAPRRALSAQGDVECAFCGTTFD